MARSKNANTIGIEDLLVDHTPDVRETVQALRELVFEVVPEAAESVNLGWHSISYRHPKSGYFCGIFPEENAVKLLFEFGVLLPDPMNVLQGDGKQVRFVTIMDTQDIQKELCMAFLQAAIDLPDKRAVKLAMIRAGAKPANDAEEA